MAGSVTCDKKMWLRKCGWVVVTDCGWYVRSGKQCTGLRRDAVGLRPCRFCGWDVGTSEMDGGSDADLVGDVGIHRNLRTSTGSFTSRSWVLQS